MPEDKLDVYIMSSIGYERIGYFDPLMEAAFPNGTRMFSPECVTKIKELYCLSFYCSDDGLKVVTEYTYEDCEDIIYDWYVSTSYMAIND